MTRYAEQFTVTLPQHPGMDIIRGESSSEPRCCLASGGNVNLHIHDITWDEYIMSYIYAAL